MGSAEALMENDEARLIAAIQQLRKVEATRRRVALGFVLSIGAGLIVSAWGYFETRTALEGKQEELRVLTTTVSERKHEADLLGAELKKLRERRARHIDQVAQFIQTRPDGELTEKDLSLLRDDSDGSAKGDVSAASFWTRGYEAVQRGDLEDARKDFGAALDLDPKYAPALNSLGVLSLNSGELAKAAEMFERALAARPWYAPAASNLGKTRVREGRYADAMLACATAKRLEPDASHLRGLLASLQEFGLECSREAAAERYGKKAAEEFQVHKNVQEAIRLFKLSCQYGYQRACRRLATLCAEGEKDACPQN